MRRLIALSSVLGLALAAGCPAREVSKIDPSQQREEYKDIPVEVNRDIDILFVIDNSGSMGEEQTSLTGNFQQFMNVLQNIEGGLPNVHIGVISSNTGVGGYQITGCGGDGDDGRLQMEPRFACQPPMGYFISDIQLPDGTRQKNYSGTLAETFACIAKLGTDGCGFEQHLESMKRALDGSNSVNQGFLRPNAYLAIIFIADEDDCSAKDSTIFDPSQNDINAPLGPLASYRCTEFGVSCDGLGSIGRSPADYNTCYPLDSSPYLQHPQAYVDFLKSLKDDPNLIIVAGIVGNPTPFGVATNADGEPELKPSCSTPNGNAAPAVRLKWFMDQFPNRNRFTSICNTDLTDALVQIAELLKRVVGNPCLEGLVDTTDLDPGTPGLQIDCQVSDVRWPGTDREEQSPIPRCDMSDATTPIIPNNGAGPCWWVEQNSMCQTPTQLVLHVEPENRTVPTGTHVIARCMAR